MKKPSRFECGYRGKKTGTLKLNDAGCNRLVYKCFHPEQKNRCILINDKKLDESKLEQAVCYTCSFRTPEIKKDEPKQSMNFFGNRNGKPVELENTYLGETCFFIGGGPSLASIPLQVLKDRGFLSFAVNNVAAAMPIKPNFWACIDDTTCFHRLIWNDPSIMKFVASERFNRKFFQNDQGELSNYSVNHCPNTYSFVTNTNFHHEKFLSEKTISCGVSTNKKDNIGVKSGRSVMLAALKIMYVLGFRQVNLLGCDFNMEHDPKGLGTGKTYCFPQYKHAGGCSTNNKSYDILNKRFSALQPLFLDNGFRVFNCNSASKLTAFPHKDFKEAVVEIKRNFPDQADTFGYYGGIENKNKFDRKRIQ